MDHYRIGVVMNGTGGETAVTYTTTNCTATAAASYTPATNTRLCFPVWWTAPGGATPYLHWFIKYAVASVGQIDLSSVTSQSVVTSYSYGAPGYRYDDTSLTKPANRTWSVFAGFSSVTTTVGQAVPRKTYTLYYRGLNGNLDASLKPTTVTVTDSQGTTVNDDWRLAGMPRETIVYNGSSVVTDTIDSQEVLTTTATDSAGRTAALAGTATASTTTPLAASGSRVTRVDNAYDSDGNLIQVDDHGDISVAAQERCTRTSYINNDAAWVRGVADQVQTRTGSCANWPSAPTQAQIITDTRTLYDNQPFGTLTLGDPTSTQQATAVTGGTITYTPMSQTGYDSYGRVTSSKDALGNTTTTSYTSDSNGMPTGAVVTSPAPATGGTGQVTSTTLDVRFGKPVKVVAPGNLTSSATLDDLGRTTAVWNPGRVQGTDTANTQYSYQLSATGPNTITTQTLQAYGTYTTTIGVFDGLGRAREVHAQSINQAVVNGTTTQVTSTAVTSTEYDDTGSVSVENGTVGVAGAPTGVYAGILDANVASETTHTYDGAGRDVKDTLISNGTTKWSTTTSYGGDRVTTVPPAGAMPSTVVYDGRGNKTQLWQYQTASLTGSYDTTSYTYTPSGQLASMTDPAHNTWTYSYNLLGQRTAASDPDTGTSSYSYTLTGNLATSTNAAGQTLAYTYDNLGRQTGEHTGSITGPLLASYGYDTVMVGQLDTSTRYLNGTAVTSQINSFNTAGQPTKQTVTIPAISGLIDPAAAGSYTSYYTYNSNGSQQYAYYAATGTMPAEQVETDYDAVGRPVSMRGASSYVAGDIYSANNQLLQLTEANTQGEDLYLNYTYNQATQQVSQLGLYTDAAGATPNDTISYNYTNAGSLSSIVTTQPKTGGATDTQCFSYDYLQRLTQAFTPSNGSCTTTPTVAGLGGPAPYWETWTYNTSSDRTKQISYAAAGNTTTTWAYPTGGTAGAHQATSMTITKGTATPVTTNLTYDKNGNTLTRTSTPLAFTGGTGSATTLTYDAEGKLATSTAGTTTTSYGYYTNGSPLVTHTPTTTTIYLAGDTQLQFTNGTQTRTTTRYYTFNGQPVAVRTSTGTTTVAWNNTQVTFTAASLNNTVDYQMAATTGAITTKRTDPFGQPRGPATTLTGNHGFVGGLNDPTNGIEHIGARDYDPATGRFLEPDPLINTNNPIQWNPYTYGNNDPNNAPDPSGKICLSDDNGGCININQIKAQQAAAKQQQSQADLAWKESYAYSYQDTTTATARHNYGGNGATSRSMSGSGSSYAGEGLGGYDGSGTAYGAFSDSKFLNYLANNAAVQAQYLHSLKLHQQIEGNIAISALSMMAPGGIFTEFGGVAASEPSAKEIIETTARAQAARGADELSASSLSAAEAAAMARLPWLQRLMLGQAVHRSTAEALEEAYPGRFIYRTRGPDLPRYVDGGDTRVNYARTSGRTLGARWI